MELIRLKKENEHLLPYTIKTLYKFSHEGRYPKLLIKVKGILYFDLDEWKNMVLDSRDKAVEKHNKILNAEQRREERCREKRRGKTN